MSLNNWPLKPTEELNQKKCAMSKEYSITDTLGL